MGGDGLGHPQRLRLRGDRLKSAKLLQCPEDGPLRAGQIFPARTLPDDSGACVVTDSPPAVENLKTVCASIPFEERPTPWGKDHPLGGTGLTARPFESIFRGLAVVGRTKPEANLEIAETVVSYRGIK